MSSLLIGLAVGLISCAPVSPVRESADGLEAGTRSASTKRIVAAVTSDLPSPRSALSRAAGGTLPGAREVEQLVHAGLAVEDESGGLRPQLAHEVPSVENGRWRVFPDGRMETTWRIRQNAQWHDGAPFTAEDLVFTARVAQDRDIAIFRQLAYDSVEAVEATDPWTITVRWSRPFIEADAMFSGSGASNRFPFRGTCWSSSFSRTRLVF